MLKLSIIIPSFQRSDLLRYGLTSLLKQTLPAGYEILVLNDGLPDETESICKSFNNLNIKYIFTGWRNTPAEIKWRIPCYAINIGFKQAQGEFILLTVPEIYHLEDIIPSMISELESNSRQMIITEGKDDREGKFLEAVKTGLSTQNQGYNDLPHKLLTEFPFFMMFSREEVISIGGYNQLLGTGYCFDDADFVGRMVCNGCNYKTVAGRVVHLYHSRLRCGLANVQALWEKNRLIYEANKGIIKQNIGTNWGMNE